MRGPKRLQRLQQPQQPALRLSRHRVQQCGGAVPDGGLLGCGLEL